MDTMFVALTVPMQLVIVILLSMHIYIEICTHLCMSMQTFLSALLIYVVPLLAGLFVCNSRGASPCFSGSTTQFCTSDFMNQISDSERRINPKGLSPNSQVFTAEPHALPASLPKPRLQHATLQLDVLNPHA